MVRSGRLCFVIVCFLILTQTDGVMWFEVRKISSGRTTAASCNPAALTVIFDSLFECCLFFVGKH